MTRLPLLAAVFLVGLVFGALLDALQYGLWRLCEWGYLGLWRPEFIGW